MNNQFEGYVVDIPYENHFYRDLTPSQIETVLSLHGISLPSRKEGEPFRYLELGFGQGMSLNINAATTEGEFWGTDFNPNHCLAARDLAEKSGAQCQVLNDSFEELYGKSKCGLLPQFDIIALHGVWSWITPESREYILQIISANLKVGGAVYVSYNCMPGWASFAPLRELLTYHAKTQNSTKGTVPKVQEAYKFMAQLEKCNAQFFTRNPGTADRLKSIEGKSISYIAHEYFNEDWYVPYFKDVAAELESAKCSFVTSTRLSSQLNIGLPDDILTLLSGIDDINLRETTRDFVFNTQFRTDIFVKGKKPAHPKAKQDLCFALCMQKEAVTYEVTVPAGKLQLKQEIYEPIVEFIASDNYKPKSIKAISEALPDMQENAIFEAIYVLFAANILHSAKDITKVKPELKDTARRLNTQICTLAVNGYNAFTLASPVLEGGVMVSAVEMLFLVGMQNGNTTEDAYVQWTHELMQKQNRSMQKEGAPLSAEDSLTELKELGQKFQNERLPLLQALCVEIDSI